MSLLKVQLNHPGKEKPFEIGKGYHYINNQIIREWNNDSTHYRKFLRCDGEYLTSLDSHPVTEKLYFWGEWEGNSLFTPLGDGRNLPHGIHDPFHSPVNIGRQNTDPYVYGDHFKYATCSQRGVLGKLLPESMILFGTTKNIGFELDTVFIVRSYETAQEIYESYANNYSIIYREETLERLNDDYLGPHYSLRKKLYSSLTWWENSNYFSFVPCRINNYKGFHKALLSIPPFARQKIGHPYQHFIGTDQIKLWKFIVSEVLKQGFYLGIRFEEPKINNEILKKFKINQSNIYSKDSKAGDKPKGYGESHCS